MKLLHWFRGLFATRVTSLSLYKRGMIRARKHDHQGAIDDYTAAMGLPDLPPELKAMVLFNRGLVHVAAGDEAQGIKDLKIVLSMDEAPGDVKSMARQKLARMQTRSKKDRK